MNTININRLSIKFQIRTDITPIFVNDKKDVPHLFSPIFIQFIYNRKNNKCKSLFYKLIDKESTKNYPTIFSSIPNTDLGFNFNSINEDVFDVIKDALNNKNKYIEINNHNDILKYLLYERNHIRGLIFILKDIDHETFTLSKLTEGYTYSFIFVDEVFENICFNLVLEKLNNLFPFFVVPNTNVGWKNFVDSIIQTIQLINLEKINLSNLLINEAIDYIEIIAELKHVFDRYFSEFNFKVSLPIWLKEHHLSEFNTYVSKELNFIENERVEVSLANKKNKNAIDYISMKQEVYNKILQTFDNEAIKECRAIEKYFK